MRPRLVQRVRQWLERDAFPWRGGNQFQLWQDGPEFYPRMLAAIGAARREILLEMYLIQSGRITTQFIDALTEAALRGVEVTLALDGLGCRDLSWADRQRLSESGIRLYWHNPLSRWQPRRLLHRDHRKLLVIDGTTAFTGGAGITDHFQGRATTPPWRDNMLEIQGPCVDDWRALFLHGIGAPHPGPAPGQPQPDRGQGRVVAGGFNQRHIQREAVRRINKASQAVWLCTPYFQPSWKLRRALRRAARRGIAVQLLLSGPQNDHPSIWRAGRRYYLALMRHGVKIHEYQDRFLHAKVLLVDEWLSLGSSNFDRWSLTWNLEANQEVEDTALCAQVRGMLQQDLALAEHLDLGRWRTRPLLAQLYENLLARLTSWLHRWLSR